MSDGDDPVVNGGRTALGRFGPNNPGRPKGSRNKSRVLFEAMASEDADKIVRTVIRAALDGDMQAARLLLDRLWVVPKDAPVDAVLPPLTGAQDAPQFARALVEAAAAGDLTASEADALMGLLAGYTKAVELLDFEERLQRLEEAHAKR